jgi:Cu+-exporting ATPase
MPADELLRLAASLDQLSQHPMAAAIVAAARSRGLALAMPEAVRETHGLGIEGRVEGRAVRLGAPGFVGGPDAGWRTAPDGEATVRVAVDGEPAGVISLADEIRADAPRALRALRRGGVRRVVLLSGDRADVAEAVAAAVGVDAVLAERTPADKVDAVRAERAEGPTAMVGDGINDAPALAAADVGIAMAGGTDVAMHTAGVTLMRGDPLLVADAIAISHRTYRKIRQNLGWAFVYNVVGIPVAALGLLNPVLAGAAMALSSVSVVTNALLLRRWKPTSISTQGAKTMYELTVQDMTCKHCVGRVTKAVQEIDQAAKVDIDLPTGKVRIDSQADLDRIAKAIDAAGYPVSARA